MTEPGPGADRSERVRELYEDYPYPGHGVVSGVVASMARPVVRRLQRELGRTELRVLDAGCGTGEQALGIARAFPEARLTGIDFSAASLAFARDLARRTGIDVRFERRNLLEPIEGLGEFDLVVSVGVLHHLPEPRVGLERLRAVVAPGGALLGMVYGRLGWQEMQWLAEGLRILCGEGASRSERLAAWEGVRLGLGKGIVGYLDTLWRRRRFGPSIGAVEAARRVAAGRNRTYYADALTHPLEATFTWGELADALEATGWTWEGWPPRSGMPDAPEAVFRGAALERARRRSRRELAAVYERLLRPATLYFLASARR